MDSSICVAVITGLPVRLGHVASLAIPGDDEIRTCVSRRRARRAFYPWDPPAVSHFLRIGCWLISEVRVTSPKRASGSMDLVAATVDAAHGIIENAFIGEDLVNRRGDAPGRSH
jgi:hypothetical protein